ncbi:Mis12 protein-domain-containing protein [Leptodontidium sp. MPI-SDFR-AT-0119]|nr:Mis12 protein-domain-containing protein [Leptodontidium sp. MPI-SDFR-AT-0119]
MSASINSDVTLLTEHLTYRPAALIDDIINSINVLAFKASEAVEKGLLSADPTALGFKLPPQTSPENTAATQAIVEKAKHEIENGVHQLETLLEAKIDKNFDKLEIVALRNILSVPPEVRDWVRLSHYEGLNFVQDEQAPNTESVTLQRRKLRETQKLHALLRAETARNEATIRSLKGLLLNQVEKREPGLEEAQTSAPFAFLQKRGELTGDVKHPVTTTTEFTISQLPALKSLLENLKPRLGELANGGGKEGLVGEEEKSWRRERLEFVERETKRHLENVRGLELGEMGEVRDGEWQGEGRKLGKGEVEDLERVVGMVGGGDPMDQGP